MTANVNRTERRIEMVPLGDLQADPRNPKAHREDLIGESIGRFGIVEAVVRDERTGYLISGHGRTETLKRMAEAGAEPPDGVAVGEDGRWLVPVVVGWASKDDSEAAAALIAMNRTTELGGWVDDALLDLLDGLSEADDGFDGVGFGARDLAALDALVNGPDDVEPLSDDDFDSMVEDELSGRSPDGDVLTISGLTAEEIEAFRSVDGEDDADRLRKLLP